MSRYVPLLGKGFPQIPVNLNNQNRVYKRHSVINKQKTTDEMRSFFFYTYEHYDYTALFIMRWALIVLNGLHKMADDGATRRCEDCETTYMRSWITGRRLGTTDREIFKSRGEAFPQHRDTIAG